LGRRREAPRRRGAHVAPASGLVRRRRPPSPWRRVSRTSGKVRARLSDRRPRHPLEEAHVSARGVGSRRRRTWRRTPRPHGRPRHRPARTRVLAGTPSSADPTTPPVRAHAGTRPSLGRECPGAAGPSTPSSAVSPRPTRPPRPEGRLSPRDLHAFCTRAASRSG
jgi:hypothetical protein